MGHLGALVQAGTALLQAKPELGLRGSMALGEAKARWDLVLSTDPAGAATLLSGDPTGALAFSADVDLSRALLAQIITMAHGELHEGEPPPVDSTIEALIAAKVLVPKGDGYNLQVSQRGNASPTFHGQPVAMDLMSLFGPAVAAPSAFRFMIQSPAISGPRDLTDVMGSLIRAQGPFGRCFDANEAGRWLSDGTFLLTLKVKAAGTVDSARIGELGRAAPGLEPCLIEQAKLLTFDQAKDATEIVTTVRFRRADDAGAGPSSPPPQVVPRGPSPALGGSPKPHLQLGPGVQ
jgi:hypothetical protein